MMSGSTQREKAPTNQTMDPVVDGVQITNTNPELPKRNCCPTAVDWGQRSFKTFWQCESEILGWNKDCSDTSCQCQEDEKGLNKNLCNRIFLWQDQYSSTPCSYFFKADVRKGDLCCLGMCCLWPCIAPFSLAKGTIGLLAACLAFTGGTAKDACCSHEQTHNSTQESPLLKNNLK